MIVALIIQAIPLPFFKLVPLSLSLSPCLGVSSSPCLSVPLAFHSIDFATSSTHSFSPTLRSVSPVTNSSPSL